ncbi:sensor domain-containing diguanylate cyclase [Nitratifractor sp.]|uniref:sensor domain-containing diguanylate cyclase n=1 Tax=Nitratifractor sp. TaxID=2268144 RepID=UPI0025DBCCA7|nr:sensor domain-containing diguanylate cyclase [Nitratifractor sp.]
MKNVQKILNAILSKNVFEYLLVDREYRIVQFSAEIQTFLGKEKRLKVGDSVFDLLPELVGSEEKMHKVFDGEKSSFAITTVSKNDRYINLYVDHFDEKNLLILLQDITEITKIRQRALQYSNQTTLLTETLKKIINSQNAMIFLANTENRIEFANQKFLEYFNVDAEEILKKDLGLYREMGPGFRSYEEMHRAISEGMKELSIGEDVFFVEAIPIDPANILFTLSKMTELARQRKELQEEVAYDQLTQVYRKKIFDDKACELLKSDRPFAVGVVDIDNFKQINDRYGHLIGDDVLRSFAKLLRREIDGKGEVARWGGEEFLLLIHTDSEKEAIELCEKIRRRIAAQRFDPVPGLTASCGVTMRKGDENLESLLARADKALYRAKGEGKNRVVYLPPVE